MKFLEIKELELLASSLSMSTPSVRVTSRLEAYSCKSVSRERKLFKSLDSSLTSDLSHSTSVSPPEQYPYLVESAFGPLDKKESRKTLWYLVATLNAAFPDHDFSRVKAEEFTREESALPVLASLSDSLMHYSNGGEPGSAPRSFASMSVSPTLRPTDSVLSGTSPQDLSGADPLLRQVLDPIINLAECEVYTYSPDLDSDPHAVDSDEDEWFENESVASSVFGDYDTVVHGTLGEGDDDTPMWEIEDLEAPTGAGHPTATVPSRHPIGSGLSYTVSVPSTPNRSCHPLSPLAGTIPRSSHGPAGRLSIPGSNTFASLFDATGETEQEDFDSAGGLLWSTHHFLFNRRMKRVLFVSAWGRKVTLGEQSSSAPTAAATASTVTATGRGGTSRGRGALPLIRGLGTATRGKKRVHSSHNSGTTTPHTGPFQCRPNTSAAAMFNNGGSRKRMRRSARTRQASVVSVTSSSSGTGVAPSSPSSIPPVGA